MIGSRDGEVIEVHRARNAANSALKYVMDPKEQLKIYTAIEDAGLDLGAIYHSHTRSAPYPSQTDINLASGWPDSVYFIVSLENPEEPYVKGFWIRGNEVEDVDLQIV